jgi:hypothetical protein
MLTLRGPEAPAGSRSIRTGRRPRPQNRNLQVHVYCARTRTFSNNATLQALTGGAQTASVCRIYPNQAKV